MFWYLHRLTSRLFGTSILQAYQYYLNYAQDLRSRKFIVLKLFTSFNPRCADHCDWLVFRLRLSGKSVFGFPMSKRADLSIIIRYQYIRRGAFRLFCKSGLRIFDERFRLCKPRSCLVWHLLLLCSQFRPYSPPLTQELQGQCNVD